MNNNSALIYKVVNRNTFLSYLEFISTKFIQSKEIYDQIINKINNNNTINNSIKYYQSMISNISKYIQSIPLRLSFISLALMGIYYTDDILGHCSFQC